MSSRRLIALLCLAAICIAALAHVASAQLFALLTPLWLFFGLAATLIVIADDSAASFPIAPFTSATDSRAPPGV